MESPASFSFLAQARHASKDWNGLPIGWMAPASYSVWPLRLLLCSSRSTVFLTFSLYSLSPPTNYVSLAGVHTRAHTHTRHMLLPILATASGVITEVIHNHTYRDSQRLIILPLTNAPQKKSFCAIYSQSLQLNGLLAEACFGSSMSVDFKETIS